MDIKKLKEKMHNVPFGNSQFQIVNFIANQDTPERIYRNVLLQLNQKLKAMQECSFRRKRREIDIEEINEKLKNNAISNHDKKRLEVDLEEAKFYLNEEIKLIEDCAIEIKTYESFLEQLPDYTREEFEKSERLYWEKRLIKNAIQEMKTSGRVEKGTLQSLEKMNISIKYNDKNQLEFCGDIKNQDKIGLIENKQGEEK